MSKNKPPGTQIQRQPVALVTGGAKRIGAAMSQDLAKAGFAVALHHHASDSAAEALANAIREEGGSCKVFQADLCDNVETQALFDEVVAAFGQVDLLVNNASVFENDGATAPDMALWDRHFAVHLKAPAMLASKFFGQPELETGLVVNIIDQRVLRLNPQFFSYSLSKSALWTATQTMAQAYAPRLRVNAIAPGPTLPNERQSQDDFDRQVAGLILKRGPQLDEFARTILFLWQTPSITGQMIALDGGQHLAWETPDIAGIRE
ncbi:MAG: SDR family oxidoreductase [Nitratireductor sp.]